MSAIGRTRDGIGAKESPHRTTLSWSVFSRRFSCSSIKLNSIKVDSIEFSCTSGIRVDNRSDEGDTDRKTESEEEKESTHLI